MSAITVYGFFWWLMAFVTRSESVLGFIGHYVTRAALSVDNAETKLEIGTYLRSCSIRMSSRTMGHRCGVETDAGSCVIGPSKHERYSATLPSTYRLRPTMVKASSMLSRVDAPLNGLGFLTIYTLSNRDAFLPGPFSRLLTCVYLIPIEEERKIVMVTTYLYS